MNESDDEYEEFEPQEIDTEEVARLQAALADDPGDLEALYELSQIYLDAGQWDDALDLYNQAVAANPRNAALLNDLAVLYDDWGQEDVAEAHYRRALAADPAHGPSYVNLGTLLAEQGRDDEAASMLREGIARAAEEEDREEAELYLQELLAEDEDEALGEDEDWVEDADWVEIAVVGGITVAEVIASSLRAAGIPALAYQEGAGQALGLTIGALGDASVLVPEGRAEEARRLVDEGELDLQPAGEPLEDDYVICPHCASTLELTEEEWAQDSVVCPVCNKTIDLTEYE
jgi:tetratricopeptide (TPR) repeat protein